MSLFRFRNMIGATLAVALLLGAGGCNSFSQRPDKELNRDRSFITPPHNQSADDKSGYLFEEDSNADGPSAAPKSPSGFLGHIIENQRILPTGSQPRAGSPALRRGRTGV